MTNPPTRVTMARVAMRAAIWTYLRATMDGCADEVIDSLTNDAVRRVDEVPTPTPHAAQEVTA